MLTRMIPGTAVGVLVGDLIYTVMAFRLAKKTGRSDVTAMPLGLDTPSTFGSVFLIIGPATKRRSGRGLDPDSAARHAWFLGITMLLASGIFKLACAPCQRLDPADRAPGRVAGLADGDRAGAHQLSCRCWTLRRSRWRGLWRWG